MSFSGPTMKYVSQYSILAMLILLGSSRLYALDNESKTQELKQVLHRIVKICWTISYHVRDLVNQGANPSA